MTTHSVRLTVTGFDPYDDASTDRLYDAAEDTDVDLLVASTAVADQAEVEGVYTHDGDAAEAADAVLDLLTGPLRTLGATVTEVHAVEEQP